LPQDATRPEYDRCKRLARLLLCSSMDDLIADFATTSLSAKEYIWTEKICS